MTATLGKLFTHDDPKIEQEIRRLYDFIQQLTTGQPEGVIDGKTIALNSILANRLISEQELLHKLVTTTSHNAGQEEVVLVDDDIAGGAVTVTLPLAARSNGLLYYIKKLGTTANVTIDGNGAETIDGAATSVLSAQYASNTLYCDGTSWHLL